MPQIFGRGADTVARVTIVGVPVLLLLVVTAALVLGRSSWSTGVGVVEAQPVPFSYKHHVNDDGLDCRYCHTSVEDSSFAGLPSTDVCMNCHRQVWNSSPILEPVRDSWRTGRPLVWNRVHVLPGFVDFRHDIHVAKGVGCSTCHGRVDQMPAIRKTANLTMGWCLDCHRQPERFIRPRDRVFDMTWQPPADQAAAGARLAAAYGVRPKTSCSVCHR